MKHQHTDFCIYTYPDCEENNEEQKNEGTECTEQHNRSNDRGGYAATDQQ